MPLDPAHVLYLTEHHQRCLATVAPDGTPQNKPVGYRYNLELGTIDIAGSNMKTSAKFRNLTTHPTVAFVVNDAVGEGASGVRFVEVRGRASQATVPSLAEQGLSAHIFGSILTRP
jgi:pyridoxamine 5'-phosphate oxidase family protein